MLLINQIKIFLDSQFTVDCGTISKKQKQYIYIYINIYTIYILYIYIYI